MSCKSLIKPVVRLGRSIGTEIITIGVGIGSENRTFSIHKVLLQSVTSYFEKHLQTEAGQRGFIFLNDDNSEVFEQFQEWLYKGVVKLPPLDCRCSLSQTPAKEPTLEEVTFHENELHQRFDDGMIKLVSLYVLGEKYEINDLRNAVIDAIQDALHQRGPSGNLFCLRIMREIFDETKPNSKLRELCIASHVLSMDSGCGRLHKKIMMAVANFPGFLPHFLGWISENFHLIARRQREGPEPHIPLLQSVGFSIFNRRKLCPCLFHDHASNEAHANHDGCGAPIPVCQCEFKERNEDDKGEMLDTALAALFGHSRPPNDLSMKDDGVTEAATPGASAIYSKFLREYLKY